MNTLIHSINVKDMPANKIWAKYAWKFISSPAHLNNKKVRTAFDFLNLQNVAAVSKHNFFRIKFEEWLLTQGCYLKIVDRLPYIYGFQEENLLLFFLKFLD